MAGEFSYGRAARNCKILIIVGSLGTLLLLGNEAWREHYSGAWRGHQSEYGARLTPASSEAFDPGIKQVFLGGLGRIDRCQTCHVGIDDPAMADAAQPLRVHPGGLLRSHSPEDFGCTICHQGQGRATWLPDAHGDVPYWEAPMLRGPLVYTSCGRCHVETDPFGTGAIGFAGKVYDPEIYASELDRSIRGAALLARGKKLFLGSGCLGCHSYRGRGGILGPDLTHIGDKGVHGYDFSHLSPGVERTPLAWLTEHFLDPGAASPGSVMPSVVGELWAAEDGGRADALALAAYMLSLKSPTVSARFRAPAAKPSGPPATGERLYRIFCVACHGPALAGSRVPEIRTPSLSNPDFLAVASDSYLETMIRHGRSGTNMPAWSSEGGGLSDVQILRLVVYIRSFERRRADLDSISRRRGDPSFGRSLYRGKCANCHGKRGEGGLGTALGSQEFLRIASDELIARTIVEGRPDTGMPAWGHLSTQEVSDILAFLRSWQGEGADKADVLARLASGSADPGKGEAVYALHCRDCHGAEGQGGIGPAITSAAFLSIVSDSYLFHAIRDGRPGTAMPTWTDLAASQIGDVIAFLRGASGASYRAPKAPVLQGDPENGRVLFSDACASCHGPGGVGGLGPQLANPVFLAHATEGFLYETISHGLRGTPMRGFARGRRGVASGSAGIAEYSRTQIADLVAFIKRLRFRPPGRTTARPILGNAVRGREIFESTGGCVACHGHLGEGGLGTALGNRHFLDQASEGFLIGTMVLGRSGTQMRKFGYWGTKKLRPEDFMDVAAYARTLPFLPSDGDSGWKRFRPIEGDGGEELFEANCAPCHGAEGRGGYAPSLNNPEFLAAASDGFLVATIATGRAGTPMRAFGAASATLANLSAQETRKIVRHIRSWQEERRAPEGIGLTQRGRWLYRRMGCVSCHGNKGRGGVPNWNFAGGTIPALNNLAEKMELYEPDEVKAVLGVLARGATLDGITDLPPLESIDSVRGQFTRVRDLVRKGKKASKRDLAGPPPPLDMPSFAGLLSRGEIDAIIAYLLTLMPWDEEEG